MQKHLVAVAVAPCLKSIWSGRTDNSFRRRFAPNRDGAFRIYAQDKLSKMISLKKGQSKVWPPGI